LARSYSTKKMEATRLVATVSSYIIHQCETNESPNQGLHVIVAYAPKREPTRYIATKSTKGHKKIPIPFVPFCDFCGHSFRSQIAPLRDINCNLTKMRHRAEPLRVRVRPSWILPI
jgi:hypothetical protein